MRKKILEAIEAVRPFVPVAQLRALEQGLRWSEERAFFREKLLALQATLAAMPVTYAQESLEEDAVVHLHYFTGGADWWITEKDVDGGVDQAFGLVRMGGERPELGYISVREIVRSRGLELDLHWVPVTLREVRAQLKAKLEKKSRLPVRAAEPAPAVAKALPSGGLVAVILDLSGVLAGRPADGVYH